MSTVMPCQLLGVVPHTTLVNYLPVTKRVSVNAQKCLQKTKAMSPFFVLALLSKCSPNCYLTCLDTTKVELSIGSSGCFFQDSFCCLNNIPNVGWGGWSSEVGRALEGLGGKLDYDVR